MRAQTKKGPRPVKAGEKPPRKKSTPPILDVRVRSVSLVFNVETTRDGKSAGNLSGEGGRPLSAVINEADFDDPFEGLTFQQFIEKFRRDAKDNIYGQAAKKRRGR